jgi:HK97 family phage major capsid protein
MPKAFELRQQRAKLVADARTIFEAAEKESRDMLADEAERYGKLLEDANVLKVRADRADSLDAIETELRSAPGRTLGTEDLPHNADKRHAYSIRKAIVQHYDHMKGHGRLDGLEREVHDEMAHRRQADGLTAPRGVLIPLDLPVRQRAELRTGVLNTTTGTGSIPTILDQTMIDLLRARTVLQPLGVTFMEGMQGLFAIPRQNQAATAAWAAEASAPATSNQTIDQVTFSPKTVGTFTDYTRRFLEQTNQNAEQFIRNDLMKVLARGLETGAINGSGSSNQPTGVLQNSTIQTNSSSVQGGTNGLAPTYNQIVSMETIVANANADFGRLAYLTNSAVRGKLKQTAKIGSTFPTFVWGDGDAPLNSYGAFVSNLVPSTLTKGTSSGVCSAILFGNWEDLIIAMWSGIDILVDPYTGGNAGTIRVNALLDADINVRHPESFSIVSDALTA